MIKRAYCHVENSMAIVSTARDVARIAGGVEAHPGAFASFSGVPFSACVMMTVFGNTDLDMCS